MSTWFKRYREFIASPVVPGNAEQTRIAALLNRVLLMFIYLFAPFVFIGPFIFPVWYISWVVFATLIAFWFFARWLTRLGYIRQLSMGIITVLWILITGILHSAGGIEGNPNAFSYATIILLAGMLLGGPGGLVATLMSIASLGLIVFLGESGRLPARVEDNTQLDEFFITSSNLMMVALFLHLSWRSQVEALEKERQLAEEAIVANRYKTDLIARVSHELRTPLSAILGLSDMLHSGAMGEMPEEQKNIQKKILYNADYLHHLVSELLEQSHIASGKLELNKLPFSPTELSNRVAATLSPVANAKGLILQLEGAENLPPILVGDFERLEEIFTNIIGNAIKFTDKGSVTVVATMPDPEHWQVAVTDTGVGIPETMVKTIFEPFRQAAGSTTRKQGGVGLGLSIAKQLTELMGGTITVESTPYKGSTFTLKFPIEGEYK
jgi:signal transduction histidine kinase